MFRLRIPLLIATLLIAFMGDAALAQACGEPGSLARETYASSVTGLHRSFTLYLPPCYASLDESLPLLLLLHGSNADDNQWIRLGFIDLMQQKIAQGEAPPMIVVLPFGDVLANENRFDAGSYDKVLLELLLLAEQRYRGNGRVAVGGISRGGFWAYHLGFRYPDRFVAIGGHSPFFDSQHVASLYNPLDLAVTMTSDIGPSLWLDRGSRDFAADGVDKMHILLQGRSIPHAYQVYAGGQHHEPSWRENIEDYLAFYSSALREPSGPQPGSEVQQRDGIELWLPAGSFATLQTSISSNDLLALLGGAYNAQLVLSDANVQLLRRHGINIHQEIRVLPDDQLEHQIWRDKSLFTLVPFDQLRLRLRPLWLDDRPVVDQLESYPLAFDSDSPNFIAGRLTRVTLSGTTAIARQSLQALDSLGVAEATSGIRQYVMASDFFQMTNEATVASTCPQFTDGVLGGANSLCMKGEHAAVFDWLAADIMDLTGNHINDFGYASFEAMLNLIEGKGIKVVGAGRDVEEARQPVVLKHNGNRIAWLACNAIGPYYALANGDPSALGGIRPGAAFCDDDWLRDTLPVLAAEHDLVLTTVHFQEYESYTPTSQQRSFYRRLAEYGADVVIGTAEHKAMIFEFYPARRGETVFIHYGLGNLLFDQEYWGNMRFFLDTLYIYAGQLLTVEIFPGIIDNQARPRLLKGEDQFNFLHFMLIQQNGF